MAGETEDATERRRTGAEWKKMLRRVKYFWVMAAAILLAGDGVAQSAPAARGGAAQAAKTTADAALDAKIQDALRERDAIIRNLLERVQELENRLAGYGGGVTPPAPGTKFVMPSKTLVGRSEVLETSGSSSSGTAGGMAPVSLEKAETVVQNAGYDEDERRASEALSQALIIRGGLLLPPGTLEVDHTVSYFAASSDSVSVNGFALLPILVVGDITSQRVRRDILLPNFTMRLGLPRRFQAEVNIPYGYELDRTVAADNTQTTNSGFGMGDLEVAVSKQMASEHGKVPDLLANVRFKTRTGKDGFTVGSSETALGSGFYGLQGNLTAAKSSDPVVFFGNLSYTANFPAAHLISANDPTNPSAMVLGHYHPGDAVGFQLGSVIALNPETSMTMGWDQRFTRVTQLNGVDVPASYLVEGSLRLGTSYVYAQGRTLDLSFGIGLTPDTPNLQFSVGLPIRFSLWGRTPR